MAKNDIRSRTITFLAIQSAILGIIMLAFVWLASVLFVKNSIRWQLNKIEQSVFIFAQQAVHDGEVPKRGDLGEYSFFMLNQDGKYILPRLPRAGDNENLWQEYELKLLYEMQKRRDGWIYYPEREQSVFSEGQYVIRYVYLDRQGWIVAAEGYLPSAWGMLKGFLTPKLFFGLFMIVCLAFSLMLLNAFWHFEKVMKAILRSQENNFIVAPTTATKSLPEPGLMRPDERAMAGGSIRSVTDRVLPKAKGPQPKEFLRPEPEHVSGPEEVAAPTVVPAEGGDAEKGLAFTPRQLDDLGAIKIDTADIRSPLLKKVIEEMRERK